MKLDYIFQNNIELEDGRSYFVSSDELTKGLLEKVFKVKFEGICAQSQELLMRKQITPRIKEELGLTVSIGVSFNKIFAKLGSDLKKPDAITVISKENFQEIIWGLPCEELLYVGRATKEKLHKLSVFTIGDIANAPLFVIENTLGKNGISLWRNANGLDCASVVNMSYIHTAKSIGKSVTAHRDLKDNNDVWRVFLQLADSVSRQLREANLSAGQVQISIRTNELDCEEHQITPDIPLRSGYELAKCGLALLKKHYNWEKPLRTVGIRAAKLTPDSEGLQCSLYTSIMSVEKRENTEESADILRKRFGKGTVKRARLLYNTLADEVHSDSCSFNFMVR